MCVTTDDTSWEILSAARCHWTRLALHAITFSLSGGAKLAAELNAVTAEYLAPTDATGIQAIEEQRRLSAGTLPGRCTRSIARHPASTPK